MSKFIQSGIIIIMSVLGMVFMGPNHQVIGCMLGILLAALIIYLKEKYFNKNK
jgi:hypothetical protein